MTLELDDTWYGNGNGNDNSTTAGHDSYQVISIVAPDPSDELTPCGHMKFKVHHGIDE